PGITGGGQYVFVQPSTPLGFVTGTVFATDGMTPQPQAVVTTDTAVFAEVTGTPGAYVVAGAPGAVQVSALLQATGDTTVATTTSAAREAVVPLDLTLQAVAPQVVAVTPVNNATNVPLDTSIRVQFSEVVNPASVVAGSVQLTTGGTALAGQLRVA